MKLTKLNVLELKDAQGSVITIPEGYTSIENLAFFDIKGIEKIIFPMSIKEMKSECITHCEDLKEIVLNDGLKEIKGIRNCKNLRKVNIPDSIEKVWYKTFNKCPLKSNNLGLEIISIVKRDNLPSVGLLYRVRKAIVVLSTRRKIAISMESELPMYNESTFLKFNKVSTYLNWMENELRRENKKKNGKIKK